MRSFTEAAELIKKGRGGKKKLANNTYLIKVDEDSFAVKLHNTNIVTFHRDGTVTLDSDGWQTRTTKERMNEYAPVRIFQSRGLWTVHPRTSSVDGKNVPYSDGMKVTSEGHPLGEHKTIKETETEKIRLDKMVKKYIDGYAKHMLTNGELIKPDDGDCMPCHFRAENPAANDPHKGREVFGLGHYLSHFEEKYYVPSILVKALQSRGYNEPAIIWHMIDNELKRGSTTMLKRELSGFFRKLKPELLKMISG